MRTEFVYSIIALGAIPVVTNATNVPITEAIPSDEVNEVNVAVGTLKPGSYTFSAKLTSKVYDVKVKITGTDEVTVKSQGSNPADVLIKFTLDKETDVRLECVSTDPGESGAEFVVANAVVTLDFNLAKAKEDWASAINALKTNNMLVYPYDDTDDKKAADALIEELNKIEDTYKNYVEQKLYQKASVPQGKIEALAATIAAHQNTQAYNDVNALITAIKGKYNAAVAELEGALVKEAAYLLPAALKDLNDNINAKITEATQASYNSYTGKTAVDDKATNLGKIPTEKALNDIVDNWKGQGTTNQAAYDALNKKVTDQQAALDAAVPEESVASLFPKTDAQTAINALNTKIENAKNSAAQLTLDVTKEEAAAQKAVGDYATKVGKANAEYKANEATVAAIKTLQDNLDAAKAAVNAMKSADGKYEAKNYYDAYVADIQKDINKFSTDAAAAYKADGTGTAQAYNAALNTAPTQAKIDVYGGTTEPAVDGQPKKAVDKYDALQTAIAKYQGELDAARAQVEGLAVYTADDYDYKTKFDLLQKRINDIKKKITAAQGLVGAEHWEAMIAINVDAAISTEIATLLSSVQANQNKYDADHLADGMTTLEEKITAFKAKDASVLGADHETFQNVETGIETAYNDVKTAKAKIAVDGKSVNLTGVVDRTWGGAGAAGAWAAPHVGVDTDPVTLDVPMYEMYNKSSCQETGVVISQTIDIENGIYDVKLFANANHANGVDNEHAITGDATDVAFVFANGKEEPITAKNQSTNAENGEYTISGVEVTDGKLTIGIKKKKAGTNWHTIQIKSLTGNETVVSNYIKSLDQDVTDLNGQQKALEDAANDVAAKVAANAKAKTDLAKNIDNLQAKIVKFVDTYKIGDDEKTTLGNRGKADGSVTKEVAEIEKALGDLETTNNGFDPTVVTDVDKSSSVNKHKAADGWTTGLKKTGNFRDWTVGGIESVEHWVSSDDNAETGVVFAQTVNNLPNGIYDIELYANAVDQKTEGKNGAAYVYANDEQASVTITKDGTANSYPIKNVVVSDGTLKIGMVKTAAGTNWHSIQIKSLTYRENDQLGIYNNDDAEKSGYNNQYTKLAAQETALEAAAPGIKTAVENNAKANTDAQTAMTNLGTYELDNLKNLKDVSNPEGNFDTTDSDGNKNNAKKADPVNWAVFRSGLANDKNYQAKKNAIDATIAAMTAAINAANSAETLPYPWADEITVTTEDDPATPDVNEASSTTYKVSDIKATVNALKTEAGAESENYWAYRNTNKAYTNVNINASKYVADADVTTLDYGNGALDKEFPLAETDLAAIETVPGEGAEPYYTGLIKKYKEERRDIIIKMLASLNGRTAVADNNDRVTELKALVNKVKAIKGDADANLKKYTEQKSGEYGYEKTQTLWNSTYTEIAATDHSSKRDEWLNALDAIQVTLTAATKAVEDNYKVGESVAKAQDFAAIQASINDVKARQSEAYNAQITEDNKAAHESFIGNETTKGAIQMATETYQTAVQERAKYSSTNEQIKKAVDEAAATLDEALYSCPTDIATLTKAENDAYAKVVSPEVFDVTPFIAKYEGDDLVGGALFIETTITAKLNTFKANVKTAISNFWTGDDYKPAYAAKVAAAEGAISGYSADAKKDAFKDVKDLIAKGDAGVASITLSEVEAAIAGLEDIDDMLAADKDAAAAKDIAAAKTAADKAYSDTKTYIEGKTIADDVNNVKATQLQNLEDAKQDADATLEAYPEETRTFDNHDDIVPTLANVVDVANNAKAAVDAAIVNDKANTKAYEDIIAAITPLEAKLAEAKEATAPYKYQTSFAYEEGLIEQGKSLAEEYKEAGTAVANKAYLLGLIEAHANDIETTLTDAFDNEKAGLASTDIPELKNQFNAYVAAKGLNETALKYQTDINNLETALTNAAIVEVDDPADGIKLNDILDATAKLIKLQNDIANKESELLAANSSTANAEVLADFNTQIGEMEKTASLEGYAEWVAVQPYGDTTLGAAIEGLKTQIADVKTAVNAEPNIAFYKDQYQKQIDAIKTDLDPVAAEIVAKQAQFDANAAAYTRLTNEINELQGKIDAAKEKVGAYEFAADACTYIIEQYYDDEDPTKLTGGVQKRLNDAKNLIDNLYGEKFLNDKSEIDGKDEMEDDVQFYLDESAYNELDQQAWNLKTLLTKAIDVANHEGKQKYSRALWQRLIAEKSDIYNEIVALHKEVYKSYDEEQGSFDVRTEDSYPVYLVNGRNYFYYTLDEDYNRIYKGCTSDADYDESQKAEVNRIKEEINNLGEAVENLNLLGDANVDGKVNVLDYQKVLNMILDPEQQPEEGTDLFTNIDINQSTVIEVGDLTAIVNYILNGDWQGYAAARSFNRGDNENLSLNYSSVNSDVQRIAVNLENANDYTAFQMDVVLPDGMKIVGTSLSSRAGQSHKLYSRTQQDGSVRILASSISGETFSGNEGAVLYIDVEGANASSVEILNILFSDVNANTRAFKLGSNVTGIDAIGSTFDALKQKVYDLGGRVMNGVKKGINIIRNADGSTRKVAE